MRLALAIFAVLSLSAGTACAQSATFADLQGTTLEADWTEDMTFRPVGTSNRRTVRSPRQITLVFGPNDTIQHKMIRVAGEQSRTENRQMQIDKAQPGGIGMVRWAMEDGKLVYIETMFSGARRLVVAVSKKDGALTCAISAGVAREGKKPVLTLGLDNVTKLELIEVKASGGNCRIAKT